MSIAQCLLIEIVLISAKAFPSFEPLCEKTTMDSLSYITEITGYTVISS